MANQAPHDLAVAVAELAAPRLAPSYCVVELQSLHYGRTLVLLLSVRPRPMAAGLEIAVHAGCPFDEECSQADLWVAGAVHAVPQTDAGIRAFVAHLTAAGAWGSPQIDEPVQLQLRAMSSAQLVLSDWTYEWHTITLSLWDPSALTVSAVPGDPLTFRLAWPLPSDGAGGRLLAFSYFHSAAMSYTSKQCYLEDVQRGTRTPPAGAEAPPPPDSLEVKRERHGQLVAADMARLRSELANVLGLACGYRGLTFMPVPPAPPPPADASQGAEGADA